MMAGRGGSLCGSSEHAEEAASIELPGLEEWGVLLKAFPEWAPFVLGHFFFWLRCAAWGTSPLPLLGIEPLLPAVEAWSLNHWTARAVPSGLER